MNPSSPPLPIDAILSDIVLHLRRSSALVVSAAPGAGKTTRVPLALLDADVGAGKQVIVLEPRRIAARAAAEFISRQRYENVGKTIGYRVRLEQRGGPDTRLWLLTEGVFSRQLSRDPLLDDVGVIVLDEFHERHLQGDVALSVVRELQTTVRPDLKLVVMSATLETDRIAAHLGNCPVLRSEGRAFPVEVSYQRELGQGLLPNLVRSALARLLGEEDDGGDVLVFLPGAAEIRRTTAAIGELVRHHGIDIETLHGDLPLEAQRRALERGERRRVVLATNVAETALTVEGVTAVIDSGLARAARFDARRGINHVDVRPISRASADQRTGRAGRTAPGRCMRLWTAGEHAARLAYEVPEIARLDLSAVLLELRAWGLQEVRRLPWLDPPPEASVSRAEALLVQLGACEENTRALTEVGRRLLNLSAPPRLARILLEAERRGCAEESVLLAALASERDVLAGGPLILQPGRRSLTHATAMSDLLWRADLFEEARRSGFDRSSCERLGLDPRRLHAVERARRQLRATLRPTKPTGASLEDDLLKCMLAGFADRVCRRREPGSRRALMVGRTGVVLDEASVVREAEYFIAIELEHGRGVRHAEARVRLASAVRREWLDELFPHAMRRSEEMVFDPLGERIVQRKRHMYFDLVLDEETSVNVDRRRAGELLAEVVRADTRGTLKPAGGVETLLRRIGFLRRAMPELQLAAEEALLRDAGASLCAGCSTLADVRRMDVVAALNGLLTHQQRSVLRAEAPVEYELPSGRKVSIDYGGEVPAVEARIQEIFGLTSTPRLAADRVPLLVRLLAPNYRPVQITDDLESFWRNTYPEIRKQLRGRYAKHHWPEDPFSAKPMSKVGRRQPC
jgi:ATP-dependent helicase HrpB